MPDKEIEKFVNTLKDTDADRVILRTTEEKYATQITNVTETAQETATMLWDKVRGKKSFNVNKTNPTNSTPTLLNEQIEANIKEKTPNAVNTVMRPDLPGVQKKSNFFKGVSYDVSLDSVEANKEIGNNLKLGTNIDVFDKSIGANLEKSYNNGSVKIKGDIEYEPLDNAAKMSLNYSAPNNSIYGSAYLNKENPGVNAGYYNKINKHSSLGASVSIFKDDAAFNANYKKTFKDNTNLTMGVYGSTRNKEIGVTARIGF